MFARPVAQIQTCHVIVFVIATTFACVLSANQSDAQQNDRSLFVIKSPKVEQSGYGQQPGAITFTPVSHQQDETTPREDDGSDDEVKDMELDDFKDLDDEDDRLLDDVDDDDFDSTPPVAPMTNWTLKPMSSITPGMRPTNGKSPADLSGQLTNRSSLPSVNSDKLFAWAAPNITYNPLYFEDVALERYGQTRGFVKQPYFSAVRFLKSATLLPYNSFYDPIDSCDGPLGYCRPGDRVNCVRPKHFFGNPFSSVQR